MTATPRKFYELGNPVNSDPIVCVFENFLSDEEVEHIVAAAKTELKRAKVSAAKSGVESPGRSGSNCWVRHDYDQTIHDFCLRLAEVVGIGLEYAESLQVVHYAADQEYGPHFDAWDADTERGKRCLANGGQRLVTCLLYLNDPEAGGGTCFPKLDMEIRAQKGRMVLFHNTLEGSTVRHPNSLHGGMPVEAGEKWACNLWFREQPLRKATSSSKYGRVI